MTSTLSVLAMLIATTAAASTDPPATLNDAYGHDDRAPNAIRLGMTAPDFTLPTADGDSLTLSALAGQTVLIFFRGDW